MNKAIFILEDKENNFQAIYDSLEKSYDCFPKFSIGNKDGWLSVKKTAENYKKKPKDFVDNLKKINNGKYDLFIIDVSLTMDGINRRPFEMIGGVIRKEVLLTEYPDVPVIFFTVYTETDIKEFMHPGDKYICKHEFGSTNINLAIKKLLIPWVNKTFLNQINIQ